MKLIFLYHTFAKIFEPNHHEMRIEEKDIQPIPLSDDPVVFVPDYVVRGFEQSLWKMEASLHEFIIVAEQMKPIDE